jgi:DNA invertase Pin-like site-specific DNA recombinase
LSQNSGQLHIAAMAELERNVIKDRVRAGLEYARTHGTKSGKAIGRPRLVFDREEVRRLRGEGLSIEKIGRQLRLSVGTVVRALQGPTNDSSALQNPSRGPELGSAQRKDLA